MAVVEVSVVPLGTGDTSLSGYVADAVRIVRESGLEYELTAMGTIIYGELEAVLDVVRSMHESCFQKGVRRVLTQVKIDDRRDKSVAPGSKVAAVLGKLEV